MPKKIIQVNLHLQLGDEIKNYLPTLLTGGIILGGHGIGVYFVSNAVGVT